MKQTSLVSEISGFIAGLALTGLVVGTAWVLFAAMVIELAHGADFGCGRDTDLNGSVDRWCPGNDADFDGYTTATGDCDDNDWGIFPGTMTAKGCSAGQFKKCSASGGTYGSCKALADMSASDIGSGVLNIYWLAADGTTGAGGGTYAAPWSYLCLWKTSLTCYHAPTAGDAFVLKGGDYTTHTSGGYTGGGPGRDGQFYIQQKDGTETNPIYIQGDPTDRPVIIGQGVRTGDRSWTDIFPFVVYESDYVYVDNIELTGGVGMGVWFVSSAYNKLTRSYIHDTDGDGGTGNMSGISLTGGCAYSSVTHNVIVDNYNKGQDSSLNPGNRNENNTQILTYTGEHKTFGYNIAYTTHAEGAGVVFKWKHGASDGNNDVVVGNYMWGGYAGCIQNSQPEVSFNHNLMAECSRSTTHGVCLKMDDLGGQNYPTGVNFENNTCIGASFSWKDNTNYTTTWGDNTVYRYNIIQDSSSSYSAEGVGAPVVICNYCSDALYTEVYTGGRLTIDYNGWHNTIGTAFKASVFGNNQSTTYGANYSSWASWVASSGYDAHSVNEDPDFDASYIAQNPNMAGWGYMQPAAPGEEPAVFNLSSRAKARRIKR